MSRIGRQVIDVPKGVEIKFSSTPYETGSDIETIEVTGPHGTLSYQILEGIEVALDDGKIQVNATSKSKDNAAKHGLTRSLINNMVKGVSSPFVINLNLQGVGYRAQVNGNILKLNLGCSHDIDFEIPSGITVKVENNTNVAVSGIEKDAVGLFASQIRNKRPPEPYNGKGVLYSGEIIRRKAGKVGK
jgi:large subunit ribosomal protein L6